ncbi:hypothetical protein Tco_0009428 [Tanacetum coccineum]
MDDLTSEAHDLLSSRVILIEDDYMRGCERAYDLESGFYMDVDKLGPPYKEEIVRINLDASFEANGSRTSEGGVTLPEELSGSKTVTEEGESLDIERDDPDDEECREAKEVEEEGEWIEYEEPMDLVDVPDDEVYKSLIEKMPSSNAYIDLDLPMNVMSLACYNAIRNRGEQGLITFMDGIKEVTFKTPYRDSEMDDLTSEAHDLLSSRVILSEDDYRRGCERASDLESGFYMDVDKLGLPYKEDIERINLDASFEANGSKTSKGGVT